MLAAMDSSESAIDPTTSTGDPSGANNGSQSHTGYSQPVDQVVTVDGRRRASLTRDNWFLVVPAVVLGVVVLYTLNRMYAAGDVRRAIEAVVDYRAGDRPPLQDFITRGRGALHCDAAVISRFYGKLDVTCRPPDGSQAYRWRVHVGQLTFAPADQVTRQLMQRYAPELFADNGESR